MHTAEKAEGDTINWCPHFGQVSDAFSNLLTNQAAPQGDEAEHVLGTLWEPSAKPPPRLTATNFAGFTRLGRLPRLGRSRRRDLVRINLDLSDERDPFLDRQLGRTHVPEQLGLGFDIDFLFGRDVAVDLPANNDRAGVDIALDDRAVAQVQSPIEPILRADKILESEGKSIRGPENSLLKINEARRRDNGQYDFRVTVRPPSMGEDMTGMFQGAVFVRRFNGRMAIMAQQEGESPTAQKLALQDAKGRSFQLVTSEESTQVNGIDITQELHLVYQSKPGMDEPAQLIYSGQRLVSIEVPFLFKNVPLSE